MPSTPHQMAMGKRELRQMLRAVRRLCGHCANGPSEDVDQSRAAMRAASSPPPISQPSVSGTSAPRRDSLIRHSMREGEARKAPQFEGVQRVTVVTPVFAITYIPWLSATSAANVVRSSSARNVHVSIRARFRERKSVACKGLDIRKKLGHKSRYDFAPSPIPSTFVVASVARPLRPNHVAVVSTV